MQVQAVHVHRIVLNGVTLQMIVIDSHYERGFDGFGGNDRMTN